MKSLCAERRSRLCVRSVIFTLLFIIFTAAAVHAAGGGEGEDKTRTLIDFGWRLLNFAVLMWFLYWMAAKKIKEFFAERRQDIKTSLEEAVVEKEDAEKKFAEYSAKIDKATEEIDQIIETIKAQGLIEKEKIIEDARKAAEKLKEDAQTRMEQELKAAKNQLRLEAVQLSVEMAEEILKKNITPEHHELMVKDYLDKVVKKH
ncbi:MAG: F0F1 ATP synthase subunit B [Deltaproteobacteria bacterium]|nr:F0F1 ATP synthase subunit B [Deltaproteobacteria bacterium]